MIETSENETSADLLLAAIHEKTGGDPGRSVSMWAVGEGLGFDRSRTEGLAMELVSEGLLEVKSLSGGVSLTESGLARTRAGVNGGEAGAGLPEFVQALEEALPGLTLSAAVRGDLELDARVLKIQLQRSTPLDAVVKAVMGEVKSGLRSAGPGAASLMQLIDSLPDIQ